MAQGRLSVKKAGPGPMQVCMGSPVLNTELKALRAVNKEGIDVGRAEQGGPLLPTRGPSTRCCRCSRMASWSLRQTLGMRTIGRGGQLPKNDPDFGSQRQGGKGARHYCEDVARFLRTFGDACHCHAQAAANSVLSPGGPRTTQHSGPVRREVAAHSCAVPRRLGRWEELISLSRR